MSDVTLPLSPFPRSARFWLVLGAGLFLGPGEAWAGQAPGSAKAPEPIAPEPVRSAEESAAPVEEPKDKPLPEQWFTGSLYAPSPSLPEAGMIAWEPYIAANVPNGSFTSNGHHSKANGGQKNVNQAMFIEYAITDHLTVYSLPTYSYAWGDHKDSSGVQFSDVPLEFRYRVTPGYTPSLTFYLGFNAPAGNYSSLKHASDGVGTGAWFVRYGVHSQFSLPFFAHVMRVRLWAEARTPVTSPHLKDISSYNTDVGFRGVAHVGSLGDEGGALEFGLSRKWVFGLDLYHSWSASNTVKGVNRLTNERIHTRSGWTGNFNVGPALEYSWNPDFGAICGVIMPVVGHNTSRALQPQCAISGTF